MLLQNTLSVLQVTLAFSVCDFLCLCTYSCCRKYILYFDVIVDEITAKFFKLYSICIISYTCIGMLCYRYTVCLFIIQAVQRSPVRVVICRMHRRIVCIGNFKVQTVYGKACGSYP